MGLRRAAGGTLLRRRRFDQVWDYLPQLVVLVALPGWGRTTLMRQCERRVLDGDPSVETLWPRSRHELHQRFRGLSAEAAPAVWFIDDLIHGADDPLWQEIRLALATAPSLRLIVSSEDPPGSGPVGALAPLILDERDLAFDPDETAVLARRLLTGPNPDLTVIPETMAGCPSLVHRYLEQVRADAAGGVWTVPPTAPELALLPLRGTSHTAEPPGDGGFRAWLLAARGMRTFTRDLLRGFGGLTGDWFARAGAYPLFTADTDAEAGVEALSWTSGAWAALNRVTPAEEREGELREGLRRILASGRRAMGLGPLLELGEAARAERMVRDDFRLFLMFTDANAVDALNALAPDPAEWPALALLQVELGARAENGGRKKGRDLARRALATLLDLSPSSFGDESARTAVALFAAVTAGERDRADRLVDHVGELLEADQPRQQVTDLRRTRRVGQLYLAYWACLQLDRHQDALRFAGVMADLSLPSDRLYALERVSLITEQDLAGLRSLTDEEVDDQIPSHAAALRLMEEGRDADALAAVRPIFERGAPSQSRSALDALVLVVRAQTDPAGLGRDEVRDVVRRSSRLWRGHRPSSFIAWATTVAGSIPGLELDRDPFPRQPEGDGLFDTLTRCAISLRDGNYPAALGHCAGLDAQGFPRFEVLAHVYAAAAQIRLENPDAARDELALGWRQVPSPRLLRFALRFVPADITERLVHIVDTQEDDLPRPLREALEAAAGDPRPVTWQQRPSLTPTEREILTLMRRGLKNSEIAAERFVTLGTLRSQIKPLYRKLGASDRAAALEAAARLRLLGEG